MPDLRTALKERFPEVAGTADQMQVVRAPGRVNLIGEHTDYNLGWVLPVAINLEMRLGFVPADDRRVVLARLDTDERAEFELDGIGPAEGSWIDYPRGVAWALQDQGVPLRGLRGVIWSDLPISSGLSSSAAFELASAWAMAAQRPPPLEPMALARACQRAENEYVGVHSGLMDQFAVALGLPDAALRLDCRSLEYRPVPIPLARLTMVVCDSHVPRELAGSAYNERREECERAVAALRRAGEDVQSLRDVDVAMLARHADGIDPLARMRAQHVVAENERVLATAEALRAGDLDAVGRAFAASHASLRDLYEASVPELDTLVAIATDTPGVYAARMTGAGFGGCTINLVAPQAVDSLSEAVAREYPASTSRQASVHVVAPAAGAGLVS